VFFEYRQANMRPRDVDGLTVSAHVGNQRGDFWVYVTRARGKVNDAPDLLAGGGAEDGEMKYLGKEYEIEIVAAHTGPAPYEVVQDTTKDGKNL
jgi:hypothetical protein